MNEIITEILQIIPATNWFFGDETDIETKSLKTLSPVIVFAVVETLDTKHPTLGKEKRIVPLNQDQYFGLSDLIGANVNEYNVDIINIR